MLAGCTYGYVELALSGCAGRESGRNQRHIRYARVLYGLAVYAVGVSHAACRVLAASWLPE
jgi:hypothetical protein